MTAGFNLDPSDDVWRALFDAFADSVLLVDARGRITRAKLLALWQEACDW